MKLVSGYLTNFECHGQRKDIKIITMKIFTKTNKKFFLLRTM